MRSIFFASILFILTSTAARANDVSAMAFYPPSDDPKYSLSFKGTVNSGKVAITNAILGSEMLKQSLVLTPIGEGLKLGDEKPGNRLDVELDVNVNQPGLHVNKAEVTVYYPYQLTDIPKVEVRLGGSTLKTSCRKDQSQPKLSDVYASIVIPANIAANIKFGDTMALTVNDKSGAMLEQVEFKICTQQIFTSMVADGKKKLMEKAQEGGY
ncbi:MAG TPA: hypothetical protein V6C76_18095 [Drouetiella sp.]